jgi:hypothetical protein
MSDNPYLKQTDEVSWAGDMVALEHDFRNMDNPESKSRIDRWFKAGIEDALKPFAMPSHEDW